MDEFNNSQGINIIKTNPNLEDHDLVFQCLELLKNQKLKILGNKELIPSTRYGFNLPSVFYIISDKLDVLFEFLIKYSPKNVQEKDLDNNMALHRCIIDNYEYGFNSIIKSGLIDVNTPGLSGWSPLIMCARNGHTDFAKILLDNGAEASYQDSDYGETALMHAATKGDRHMVEVLLPKSDKNQKSFSGQRAYDCALAEGHVEIASLLK